MILYDEKTGSEYEDEFARSVTTPTPPRSVNSAVGIGLLSQYLSKYRKSPPPTPIRRESDQSTGSEDSSGSVLLASPTQEASSDSIENTYLGDHSSRNIGSPPTHIHQRQSYLNATGTRTKTETQSPISRNPDTHPQYTASTSPSSSTHPNPSLLYLTKSIPVPDRGESANPTPPTPASATAPQAHESSSDGKRRQRHERREGDVRLTLHVRGSRGRCEQEVVALRGSVRLNLLPSRGKIKLKVSASGRVELRLPESFTGVVRTRSSKPFRPGVQGEVTLVQTYPDGGRVYFIGDVVREGYVKGMSDSEWVGNVLDLHSRSGDVALLEDAAPRPGLGRYLASWFGFV